MNSEEPAVSENVSTAATQTPAAVNANTSGGRVSVAEARSELVPLTMPASGSLVARREIAVNAELLGYPVLSVEVDVNDRVSAGQVLVRLDTQMLEIELRQNDANAERAAAAITQAEAAVSEAQSAFDAATAELERAQKLRNSDVVSEQALGERQAALEQARAKLESAKAGVDVARADLGVAEAQADQINAKIAKGEIRAPVDGVVLTRAVEPGAILAQGSSEPLLRILAEQEVDLAAELPDVDLSVISPGQDARVFLADGTELAGKVRVVLPVVDGRSRLGTVRISLPHDPRLRPGAYARAEIVLSQETKVTIPVTSLVVHDGKPTVFVVNEAGVTERRVLELGASIVEERLVVERGVVAGEQVVLSGAFVREGEVVRTSATEQPE